QSTTCNHNWHHFQHKKDDQNPSIDGNHYYDCKKRSGVTNSSILNFTHPSSYPGSCHDSY
ncbi:hypothetical protein VP01_11450g1, partial [Puccinia sorghi]